ncbi:hypothetical protein CFBP6762_02245 [Xanthomonas arboricola pv. fragariae]|nr:hypothetical protein CFBP6762_02245 [Xanthomonas arboricola pv. fragariae]
MRALPDKWNPRVLFRDWLLKPPSAESSTAQAVPVLFSEAGLARRLALHRLSFSVDERGAIVGSGMSDRGPFVVTPDGVEFCPSLGDPNSKGSRP